MAESCAAQDGQRPTRLPGPLSHLSSLAPQSSHTLLSPLGTHAAVDVEEECNGLVITHHAVQASTVDGLAILDDSLNRCIPKIAVGNT